MRRTAIIFTAMIAGILTAAAQSKREFRGAWIQCVNEQFVGMSTQTMQATLTHQLNELQKDGVNAIIFQVRPECDALYQSDMEPWSRYLTGQQGKAPSPYWDPLQWMIEQCHKRGMELHAWINPYRAKTKATTAISKRHIAATHPERMFTYDGLYILNPALDVNREYICSVVADIMRRYDVDGIHIDDYFYPYPVAGQTIPDASQFRTMSNGISNIGDWRRYNVNLFVSQLHDTIASIKPWVKFGVSPFGIYRNKKSDPNGSATSGLQNYDDLYADVLLWVNNGWVDYIAPQLYWQIGNTSADYETLIKWWNRNAASRPIFIGEDVERTAKYADPDNDASNQLPPKMRLHNSCNNVEGTVLWYAKAVVDNVGNIGGMLRNVYWKYPALQPLMPFIDDKAPKAPKKLKDTWTSDGYMLFWTAPKGKGWQDEAHSYVVYRFPRGEDIRLNNPANIVAITTDTHYRLPYRDGSTRYVYLVTALDRMQNESKGVKIKVKL